MTCTVFYDSTYVRVQTKSLAMPMQSGMQVDMRLLLLLTIVWQGHYCPARAYVCTRPELASYASIRL
jgi:hypothetical protein